LYLFRRLGERRSHYFQIFACAESHDLKLIPTVIEKKQNLRDILSQTSAKSALILIGPEGDFTKQELTQAANAGLIPVSLGSLVLRIDTAAIAVATFFRLNEAETYGAKRS